MSPQYTRPGTALARIIHDGTLEGHGAPRTSL
jgi:hypothetical protein